MHTPKTPPICFDPKPLLALAREAWVGGEPRVAHRICCHVQERFPDCALATVLRHELRASGRVAGLTRRTLSWFWAGAARVARDPHRRLRWLEKALDFMVRPALLRQAFMTARSLGWQQQAAVYAHLWCRSLTGAVGCRLEVARWHLERGERVEAEAFLAEVEALLPGHPESLALRQILTVESLAHAELMRG